MGTTTRQPATVTRIGFKYPSDRVRHILCCSCVLHDAIALQLLCCVKYGRYIFYQLRLGSFRNVETDLAAHGRLPAHQGADPL